ncbi:MAG: hypothetical protein KGL39_24185 [Patescibacteria group bacterium]|nr:hypothetical protein [Patescibacteria group bacterium]
MARTRGISQNFHQDDGIVLGKNGEPISPTPVRIDRKTGTFVSPSAAGLNPPLAMNGNTVLTGPGAMPVSPLLPVVGYRATGATISRDMDGWELWHLLDLAFKHPGELGAGLVIELTEAEWLKLSGDLRRHFMPVRLEPILPLKATQPTAPPE